MPRGQGPLKTRVNGVFTQSQPIPDIRWMSVVRMAASRSFRSFSVFRFAELNFPITQNVELPNN